MAVIQTQVSCFLWPRKATLKGHMARNTHSPTAPTLNSHQTSNVSDSKLNCPSTKRIDYTQQSERSIEDGDRRGWVSCNYTTQLNENVTDSRRVNKVFLFFSSSTYPQCHRCANTSLWDCRFRNHDSAEG